MTTTQDLLIGPSTTAAPTTTLAPRHVTDSSVTRTSGSSDPKVWAVSGGLVAVAIALAIATVMFWRRTRPGEGDGSGPGDGPGGDSEGPSRRRATRGRSRYADLVVTSPEP
ncbi:MAG: hypothetical protein JST73_11795 [Actinobacteria bacterium]|nr:hypothetical protein [Actinomycetota bacterium]